MIEIVDSDDDQTNVIDTEKEDDESSEDEILLRPRKRTAEEVELPYTYPEDSAYDSFDEELQICALRYKCRKFAISYQPIHELD